MSVSGVAVIALAALVSCQLHFAGIAWALDNGLALTPVMGFNSYMAGLSGESGLTKIADYFVESGLREKGYVYVNTDEGWEMKQRDAQTGELRWDENQFPSGLPNWISTSIHARGLKFGIYGAASGVTCGVDPGQLYYELRDARTYASWGVDYVKSDNCASYAMDPSVRFGALRDAMNATGRAMVLSIEPFSIAPDPLQSREVSNLWRVACDIGRSFSDVLNRADISDKWAPLAGPGSWNDPDMIHLQNSPAFTLGENRVYFGLWAIMKAPLLLSSDLTQLDSSIIDLIGNEEVIAINQDALGVQARKVDIDGTPLPWHVGLEDCSGSANGRFWARTMPASEGGKPSAIDTRAWTVTPSASNSSRYTILNRATERCLAVETGSTPNRVVLLPCRNHQEQLWIFDKGVSTVTSIVSATTGKALAISNATLYSSLHGKDGYAVSDLAYGHGGMILTEPYDQRSCSSRDCQNYDSTQMWFWSRSDGLLRHSTYVASINHKPPEGGGYTLTSKVPTFRHHCLAHVLSVANLGTEAGATEVWRGPLVDSTWIVGLLNRGSALANITAPAFAHPRTSFSLRNLWTRKGEGKTSPGGAFTRQVPPNDLALFKLTKLK